MNTDEAYQQCEQITWEQARNFAYGIRLLPRDKRRALAAVYAFARRIDDIGDGDLPPETKTAQLEQARDQVHALVAAAKDAKDGQAAPAATASTTTTRCWSPWSTRAPASTSRWRRSPSSSTAAWPT